MSDNKCFDFSEFGVNLIAIIMLAIVVILMVSFILSLKYKLENPPKTIVVERPAKTECTGCNCGCEKCKCVKGK